MAIRLNKPKETLTVEEMTGKTFDNIPLDIESDEVDEVDDKIAMIAMTELTDMTKIKTVSRIKMEQVPVLTKLYLFDDTFNTPFTSNLADNILKLQISIRGLGRKELVQVVNRRQDNYMVEEKLSKKEVFR